jgi:hypothetical protein
MSTDATATRFSNGHRIERAFRLAEGDQAVGNRQSAVGSTAYALLPAASLCSFPDCFCAEAECEAAERPAAARPLSPWPAILVLAAIPALTALGLWLGSTWGN